MVAIQIQRCGRNKIYSNKVTVKPFSKIYNPLESLQKHHRLDYVLTAISENISNRLLAYDISSIQNDIYIYIYAGVSMRVYNGYITEIYLS